MSVAAKLRAVLPDELGEMSPLVEVAHVWRGLAVLARGEFVEFAVVPAIASSPGNRGRGPQSFGVPRGSPHRKVLAIATAADSPIGITVSQRRLEARRVANSRIVPENATLSQGPRILGMFGAPLKRESRVVGAVNIVVVERRAHVVGRLRRLGFYRHGLIVRLCGFRRLSGGFGGGLSRGLGGGLGGRLSRSIGGWLDRRLRLGRRGRRYSGRLRGRLGTRLRCRFGSWSRSRGRRGRRRGRSRRAGRGGYGRRCRRHGLHLGTPVGATVHSGSVALGHRNRDPLNHDVRLDVKSAILEDRASEGEDGAAGGEEGRGLHCRVLFRSVTAVSFREQRRGLVIGVRDGMRWGPEKES